MSIASWLGRRFGLTTASDQAFFRAWLGGGTASGKTVTADNALQVAAVWACIRRISETVGTLPLGLYRRLPNGGKAPAQDDPLYRLLHDAPNADATAAEFWEGATAGLCTWGDAFAWKDWSGTGASRRLVALTLLRPDLMAVRRDQQGVRRYTYDDGIHRFRDATEDEVFHVRGFGFGGDRGLSPIAHARQSIGSALAADETAGKMFANGLLTSGFLKVAQALKPDQRTQLQTIIDGFTGAERAGKLMILEAGMDYAALTLNPEDAQLLQSRAWSVEDICRWYVIPPILIGHAGAGQTMWGTGVEQIMVAWNTLGLRPYCTRIEQAIKRSLLTPAQRVTLFAEFNVEGLLRGDSASRSAFLSAQVQNGLMTRNEGRALDNRPPLPGGDQLTVQSNLVPLDKLGQAQARPTQPAPGEPIPETAP